MRGKQRAAMLVAVLGVSVALGIPQTASAETACGMVAPFTQVSTTASCGLSFKGNPVRVEGAIAGGLLGPACIEAQLCLTLTEVDVVVSAPGDPSAGSVSCSNFLLTVAGGCRAQGRLNGLSVGTPLLCKATFSNFSQPIHRQALGDYRCSSGATSL